MEVKDIKSIIHSLFSRKDLKLLIFAVSVLIGFFAENLEVEASNSNFLYSKETGKSYNLSDYDCDYNELGKIKTLCYTMVNDANFDWIRFFPNLNDLTIVIETDDKNLLSEMKKIKDLKNLNSLSLVTSKNISLTREYFSFLDECLELRNLDIDGFSIEAGLLENLTGLKKLSLNNFYHVSNMVDIDYKKMTFLKELNFKESRPYDITVCFDKSDYDLLKSCGVDITSDVDGYIDQVIKINDRLDDIVQQLGIVDSETDKDKFNKILIYILDNLEYDEEISLAVNNNQDNVEELASKFYSGGRLYGALEMDSAICGNYAALFTALASRVGLNSYYLCNSDHAWNLIEIDGYDYYTDVTWMDAESLIVNYYSLFSKSYEKMNAKAAIENDYSSYLSWYLVNPIDIDDVDIKDSHVISNLPDYVKESLVCGSDNVYDENASLEKYRITSGERNCAILISILIAIKILLARRKKKLRIKIIDEYLNMLETNRNNMEPNSSVYVKRKFERYKNNIKDDNLQHI